MKGKYRPNHSLWCSFDLKEDRELQEAYMFWYHGCKGVLPYIDDEATKKQLLEIGLRLEQTIVAHNERIRVTQRYDICVVCKAEIDKGGDNFEPADDLYPGLGLKRHKKCPVLKPPERRNL